MPLQLLWILALFCVAIPGQSWGEHPPETPRTLDLAIVIGNNHHLEDPRWNLRFADDDALDTAGHLKILLPDAQTWLLTELDEETLQQRSATLEELQIIPPTLSAWTLALQEVEAVISEARGRGDVRVRLFLHFSGHGQRGGSLHLADTLLPPQRFRQDLAQTGADEVFALMDGCHLALVIRGDEGMETIAPPPIFLEEDLDAGEGAPWLGLIGSTTAVPEHDYLAGGLLTRVGMSGLLGPADLDSDSRITFSEWSRYISDQVGVGSGPKLVMVPPHGDWQTTVVDLSRSSARGIRLETTVPPGQVRILESESHQLVAEFLHHGTPPITLHLTPGNYDVILLGDRDTWEQGAYPAERLRVVVQTGIVSISGAVETERIVMVPENLRGPGTLPEGAVAVPISDWEARSLLNSPFDHSHDQKRLSLPPSWGIDARTYGPWMGPELASSTADDAPSPLHPGLSLGLNWMAHPKSRGRHLFSLGPTLQFGLWRVPEAYDGTDTTRSGLRQELRLGLALEQTHSRPRATLSLSQLIAYAPSVVTSEGGLLKDSASPGGAWRYVYLRNVSASATAAIRWRVGESWTLGPSLRIEAVRFQLSPQVATGGAAVVSWEPLLSLGLDLRQSPFRRP